MSCISLIKFPTYIFEWKMDYSYSRKGVARESNVCYAGSEKESCWKMRFYPEGVEYASNNYTSFELILVHGLPVKVSGTVSLIQHDEISATLNIYDRVFTENDTHTIHDFVKKSDINYPITIRCELKLPEDRSTLPYIKRSVDFNQVITDIHSLLTQEKNADVSIVSEDQREHRAHKVVLAARSEVFTAMFESNMTENQEGRIEISDMKGSDVEEMLHYIYSGNLVKWSLSLCMNLFVAGDKYKINGLKETCSLYLQQNMATDIAAKVLVLADMHGDKRLKEVVLNFIKNNAKGVLETNDWDIMVKEQPHLVKEVVLKMT